MPKYTITLDEKQADLIVQALDLFTRIGIGQFEEIVGIWLRDHINTLTLENIEKGRDAIGWVKRDLAGFSPNESFGIHNPEVPDKFRVAADLLHVIRNRLAWDKNPGGGIQVWYDKPEALSESPLAAIKREDEDA